MCTVHVNQVCDGEVPECYDGWDAKFVFTGVRDAETGEFELNVPDYLVTCINELEWALENYDGACCGMACDCHQNNKSDLIETYAELSKLGYAYIDGLLVAIDDVEVPACVSDAQESYYPDEF